jgi:hypothetical protein
MTLGDLNEFCSNWRRSIEAILVVGDCGLGTKRSVICNTTGLAVYLQQH